MRLKESSKDLIHQSLGLSLLFLTLLSAIPCLAESSATIRNIKIEIQEVFNEKNIGNFYKTVNALKSSTKKSVIKRELLFKEGEVFDQFLLEESERNLRSLRFLRKVSITPSYQDNYVDILVSVQDTWTLLPQLSFSSGSGSDKRSIGLADSNILGLGKRAEIKYIEKENRENVGLVLEDPRFLGTQQRLLGAAFKRTDGYRVLGLYSKPFRSLIEPFSWQSNVEVSDLVEKLYEAGDERFIFRKQHHEIGAGFTASVGDPESLIFRYTLGYNYSNDEFKEADDQDFRDIDLDPDSVSRNPELLATNRIFSGPTFAFQRIEPDFLSMNYIDRFERVEDFNLGNEFNLILNYAAKAFGSDRDTLLLSITDSEGYKICNASFIRGEIGTAARLDNNGIDNFLLHGEAKYYNSLGPKYLGNTYIGRHTLAFSIALDIAESLDRDKELLLGANRGLRGYEANTFTGDHRLVMNLEDRMHFVEDVFKLFNVGGAVFLDAGGTSRKNALHIISKNLHANIGVGLRIGLPRSSSGNVVRIDLAFPLRNGDDGSSSFEPRLVISTGQLFSSKLRNESLGPERRNVSVTDLR